MLSGRRLSKNFREVKRACNAKNQFNTLKTNEVMYVAWDFVNVNDWQINL